MDHNGLEVVPRDEALRLAATVPLGRVAVIVAGTPVMVPVNFRLLAGDVVFRTASDSKLLAAVTGAVVSFEVDEFDPGSRSGWSVLISGPASEVLDPAERAAADRLEIDSWAGDWDRYVRVASRVVSGRRLRRGAPAAGDWLGDWDVGFQPG